MKLVPVMKSAEEMKRAKTILRGLGFTRLGCKVYAFGVHIIRFTPPLASRLSAGNGGMNSFGSPYISPPYVVSIFFSLLSFSTLNPTP